MHYNRFITPEVPQHLKLFNIPSDYVYIGRGTGYKKHSLAYNWNASKPFPAYVYSGIAGTFIERTTIGDDVNAHIFVKNDSPILSAMFPYDPEYCEKEMMRLKNENRILQSKYNRLAERISDIADLAFTEGE